MQAIVETVFDIVYLCTVITLGLIMIRQGRGHRQYVLFGIMAVTLGAGDAFHLVPRAIALCTTGLENYTDVYKRQAFDEPGAANFDRWCSRDPALWPIDAESVGQAGPFLFQSD